MIIEQGLNNEDWQTILSKIKRANIEQLIFIKSSCDTEIVKRKRQ